ncbi:hypothetical protein [Bartonella apis]|uniref:hypothetical protein n=1 Tax=Bartonella apis TaxID=1686310 RepID=UPI003BB500AD
MSLDNKYILHKNKREKIGFVSKIIIYSIMTVLSFLNFSNFLSKINIFIVLLILFLFFIVWLLLIIIEFSEKAKGKIYKTFFITFFICIFFSSTSQLISSILNNNNYDNSINENYYLIRVLSYGDILGLYSFIVGTSLLFFNNFINAFLFPYSLNRAKFEIDIVSNRFSVDVLTYTIYVGALFGLAVYSLCYSKENEASFFVGINVTHVALATVGVVTFFWAAKSAKNKSIELDMTRTREAGRLFSDGSHLLSAPHNDKKYVGLSYLNKIASQSEGPLQKEAINLMADFILNANDITTANKPRIRAMEYLSDRLKIDFLDDDIDQLIKLSSSELTESNQNYRFSQLNVIYENFNFSNDKKYLRYKLLEENKIIKKNEGIWSRLIRKNNSKLTEDDSCKLIAYNNCNFENYSGQNGIEKIILVYAQNCSFKNCKIGIVKGYSKKPKTGQKGESTPSNNKFEQCDFSDSDGWNILRPSNRMEGEIAETVAENAFINCYYYSGHEPEGFNKEIQGKFLIEITSKEQFEQEFKDYPSMYFSPPKKNKRKQSHARKDN